MDGSRDSNTCRVCLRSSLRKYMSLFEDYMSSTIALHLCSLVNFTISLDDGFPNKICLPCFKELQSAVQFKHKCELSHATLLSTITAKKEDDLKEEVKTEVKEKEKNEIIKDEYKDIEESEEYLEADNVHSIDEQEYILGEETGPAPTEKPVLRPSRVIEVECHDCGEIFKSKCKLKVHWNKEHLPSQLVCKQCKKKCGNYRSLNKHKKQEFCQIVARTRIEGEGKNRVFYCKQCSYKTKFSYLCVRHVLMHSGVRAFVCKICNIHYTQFGNLQRHKESKHKLYEGEGTCHICGKFIKGKTRLREHIHRHKLKTVKCETCGKVLRNKNTLAIHMAGHSDLKPYTCEICAYTSNTLANLTHHKRTIHLNIRYWFYCDLCDYKCQGRIPLQSHRDKHTSTNFPCGVCGRFYENEEQLKKHQLSHFGERNFICNFCEKAYLTNDTLRKHIAKVHKVKASETPQNRLKKDSKLTKEGIELKSRSTENIVKELIKKN